MYNSIFQKNQHYVRYRMSNFLRVLLVNCIFTSTVFSRVIIYGRVTDTEGNPMLASHVFLTYPSSDVPLKSVAVRKDGKYRIIIDSNGLWMLHFIGTFHHRYSVPFYCFGNRKVFNLNVKLGTYSYENDFSGAGVIGNFNGWSVNNSIDLQKEDGGTFTAVISSKYDTILYRLVNVRTGGEVEGTSADGYIPNGIEGYNSFLLTKNGRVKIIFDPSKLVCSTQTASFELTPSNSVESRFAKAYAILENNRYQFRSKLYAHVEEHRGGFKFNFAPVLDSIKVLQRDEPDQIVRQVLQLDYFVLAWMNNWPSHHVDVRISRQTLNIIPPNSVVWSLDPTSISEALDQAAFTEPEKDQYVHKIIDTNPIPRTKEILLRDWIDRKFYSLQYSAIPSYLEILLDQYGDSPEALVEGKRYSNYLRLNKGELAPKFSVPSVRDSALCLTNDLIQHKFCLLYFWSMWDKPSVDGIGNLRDAYFKFKRDNFVILGISLDSLTSALRKWTLKMPWPNGFVTKAFNSQICKDYDVYSVPKSVLIEPDGRVAEIGWNLRSKNLINVLQKYIRK
jgi:peroxiredoxin